MKIIHLECSWRPVLQQDLYRP